MSYLGNSPPSQNFVAGADQFSGTGSQTVFTLSRVVNTVFDIFVTVSNVPQDPFTAYTVAGNTLTFDGAPPAGTNNIDVVYRATNVQTFVPSPGVSAQFGLGSAASPSMTFIGDTNTGIYSPAADTIAFTEGGIERMRLDSAGNVGIGTTSPSNKLDIVSAGSSQIRVKDGVGATAYYDFGRDGTDGFFGFSGAQTTFSGYKWSVNAGTEVMRITNAGNVGIGTSSPGVSLDVAGRASTFIRLGSTQPSSLYLNNAGTYSFIYTQEALPLLFGTAAAERARIDASGNVLVTGGGGLGYGTGSGGTVTQATNKVTAVTLNKATGQITMSNAALAAGASVSFSFFNSLMSVSDTVVVNGVGPISLNYRVECLYMTAGACLIRVTNIGGVSLSEALQINFAIIKGATS